MAYVVCSDALFSLCPKGRPLHSAAARRGAIMVSVQNLSSSLFHSKPLLISKCTRHPDGGLIMSSFDDAHAKSLQLKSTVRRVWRDLLLRN